MTRFRIWLAKGLRRLAAWIDIKVQEDELFIAARLAVADTTQRPVYGPISHAPQMVSLVRLLATQRKLEKMFPTHRTRDIRYAIEQAVQELT